MKIEELENITRYDKDFNGTMVPHPQGDYVDADVFDTLLDQYKELVGAVADAASKFK